MTEEIIDLGKKAIRTMDVKIYTTEKPEGVVLVFSYTTQNGKSRSFAMDPALAKKLSMGLTEVLRDVEALESKEGYIITEN